MTLSYADEQRRRAPLEYEQSRLIIDVATELKLALEDSGLTQRALADRLGRTPGMVSRQLNGYENLSLGKVAELAFALGKRLEVNLVNVQRASVRDRVSLRVVWSQPERPGQRSRLRLSESPTVQDSGVKQSTAA